MKKDFNITIKWSLCEKIARYYQFPVATFLLPADTKLLKGTRKNDILKRNIKMREALKQLRGDNEKNMPDKSKILQEV
jgi:hypothetical protein